jgi:hypothetical protein
MASQWRGESSFSHLERQRSTVAAGDGGTIQVDLSDGGSLLRRSVRPASLVQKRRCYVLELAEGSPWPRTPMGGGAACGGSS